MKSAAFLSFVFSALFGALASTQNIVQLAQGNADLSILVSALTAGGLTSTLSGKGPFTVFAPTNKAFSKLDTTALEALLANRAELDKILEYHVLEANLSMLELMAVKVAKTFEGENVIVSDPGSSIKVNNANVLTANVEASNGVIHIIDSVLVPPSLPPFPPSPAQNIVELCESEKDLSTLVAAVVAAGLADTLSSSKEFTLFAPTNEAFNALPAGTLNRLMKPENKQELVDILTYHVLPEEVLSTDLKPFQAVATVEGKPLHVTKWGGHVRVGPSLSSKDLKNVIKADNLASNGVVHIINGVLLPPSSDIIV